MSCRWSWVAVAAVAGILPLASPPAAAADWEWELVPYVWATDVGLEATIDDDPLVDTTADFGDLLDKLEMAAMLHFEGRRGRAGFFIDTFYADLGEDQTITGRPLVPDGTTTDLALTTLIVEAGGTFRPRGPDSGLDILLGARVLDQKLDVEIDPPSAAPRTVEDDETYTDAFAGLRYRGALSKHWVWWVRGDAGAGDTELSWSAALGFGRNFGDSGKRTLILAYRHVAFDIENSSDFGLVEQDLVFTGPAVGFRFGF